MKIKINASTIALFLMIIQGIGIRFFAGQGSVLTVIILVFTLKGIARIKGRDVTILLLILLFLIVNKAFNVQFPISNLIYQYGLVFNSYALLLQYGSADKLYADLEKILRFIFYHALIGYLVIFMMNSVCLAINLNGFPYKTFFYIFYVSGVDAVGIFDRNVGLLWEPGLLQLLMNIFLFINIKKGASPIFLLFIVLVVISTYSTVGYFVLILNFAYYIILNSAKKKNRIYAIFSLLVFASFFSVIATNASSKFDEANSSGLVRLRDYYIGINLIQESPIIGHGIYSLDYLLSKNYVNSIERNMFSKEYLDISGDLGGGYTNGIFALLSWFGIPAGLYIFYKFYKNAFFAKTLEKTIFFLIFMVTCISEPVTYTSLFLLIVLSSFVFVSPQKTLNY